MEQARDAVRVEMIQQFQTELEQAKEMAKYELEQEHLENLKQLETNLEQKHAEQLSGLMKLQGKHEEDMKQLKVCTKPLFHEATFKRVARVVVYLSSLGPPPFSAVVLFRILVFHMGRDLPLSCANSCGMQAHNTWTVSHSHLNDEKS